MTDTCFVIMPYGIKKDIDDNKVDFDFIYKELISKSLKLIEELDVVRCDDIEKAGWIHERMITHILEDRVAIVDTSTLNANVFYELGVRHALRKSVTVLIHRKGTSWPFNISGMSSIEYGESAHELKEARRKIRRFVENGISDETNVDSLVHVAVPGIRVERGPARVPERITRYEVFEYPLASDQTKNLGVVTGNYEDIKLADVWVNSENTDMQMDSYYGKSTSATIRYLGARKHEVTGRPVEDTIANELARKMAGERSVEPAHVVTTSAGELAKNNVRWIFHVASVIGQTRDGYHPIERIERCVTAVLRAADGEGLRPDPPHSIFMPIFGTGPGSGDLRNHAKRCIDAVVEYFIARPDSVVERVYIYAWSDVALETCQALFAEHEAIGPRCEDGCVGVARNELDGGKPIGEDKS